MKISTKAASLLKRIGHLRIRTRIIREEAEQWINAVNAVNS